MVPEDSAALERQRALAAHLRSISKTVGYLSYARIAWRRSTVKMGSQDPWVETIKELRRQMRALNREIRLFVAATIAEFSRTEIARSVRHTVDSHRTRGPNRARKTLFMTVFRELAPI